MMVFGCHARSLDLVKQMSVKGTRGVATLVPASQPLSSPGIPHPSPSPAGSRLCPRHQRSTSHRLGGRQWGPQGLGVSCPFLAPSRPCHLDPQRGPRALPFPRIHVKASWDAGSCRGLDPPWAGPRLSSRLPAGGLGLSPHVCNTCPNTHLQLDRRTATVRSRWADPTGGTVLGAHPPKPGAVFRNRNHLDAGRGRACCGEGSRGGKDRTEPSC